MNADKMMRQFHAIFGVFMVCFYLGVGTYLFFFAKLYNINSALTKLMGGSFLLFGIYRVYTTYKNIVKVFNTDNGEEDE